jgi:hypothetical protein
MAVMVQYRRFEPHGLELYVVMVRALAKKRMKPVQMIVLYQANAETGLSSIVPVMMTVVTKRGLEMGPEIVQTKRSAVIFHATIMTAAIVH